MNRDQLMQRFTARFRLTGLHRVTLAIYAYLRYWFKDARRKPHILKNDAPAATKVAVFAIFQMNGLSDFCRRELLYLKQLGYDVVLSMPHGLPPADLEFVLRECKAVIQRENFGRDFGSYRDAILAIGFEEFSRYERILLVNDSIYFPIGDTTKFESEFCGATEDVVALCENIEFTAHIGSYFIEFSKRLFCSEGMRNFWMNYRPLNSRIHAIHAGEYGLSQIIYKGARSIRILYSHERVVNDLISRQDDFPEWPEFRRVLGFAFNPLKERMLSGTASRSPGVRKFMVIDSVRHVYAHGSPSHTFGLALIKYFNAPFLKRDVYFRVAVDLPQVSMVLSEIESHDVVNQIIFEMRRKGTKMNLPTWDMFLNYLDLT
ncbi:rhamnan synthesis F family protein [Burkholderia multivorans]|uniref:rhamnan synthesis F family protein n=1 Tax=Burkholderia multivorans TaxID=87883 RepID=UPI0009BD66B6|nr:rhamnan synthesis F family protein [Burkholderia multivorans]MBR8240734.1 hypothetical protein [Burkholderia multivorans]MDR9178251.1 hypothetical protein [Burkholderia multivorans]MDR9182554.1 hypothetical protein [Burkholderia multivorans]MDR9188307.1 hypothetical protein [Burkholderia multivorans]MDR9195307.1 hypothetical protein [Burkholderia multivorans]